MDRLNRKILYRIVCLISLVIGLYLIVDLKVSGTLNTKMILVFILLLVVIIWGTIDWKINNDVIKNQEKELKLYQHYIQPLEELVKEIRARQHEFDNHLNAILNMHLTVDNYEELVEKQSQYIHEVKRDSASRYLPLLRITDKVLAGFLYSKIISSPENVETDVEIRNWEIISRVSEHSMIEIAGILVDNAYEACAEKGGKVKIYLDSREDRMSLDVLNQYRRLSLEEIGHFFENGYSTKGDVPGKRGIGLNRVKTLVEKANGEITVGQEETNGENYIHFSVVI